MKPSELLDSYLSVVNSFTLNEEFRLEKIHKLEVEKNQFDALAAEIVALKQKIK